MSKHRVIKIAGASAFWGDTQQAAHQLLAGSSLDYITFDYLAEMTMTLLAAAKAKNPDLGYTPDFISLVSEILPELARKKVRVVTNAGGLNPRECAAKIQAVAAEHGLKVAVVEGDNALPLASILPVKLAQFNAYFGAQGIVEALKQGADIVITGRVVDSALVLAPLIYEFSWSWNDFDLLASGSLAGHLLECGVQCTGGNFTDWQQIRGFANMGFPIAECRSDGSFAITKPIGTGGLVSPATVGEQLVYEIADPQNYFLPDVICDWSQVQLKTTGVDRVEVTGAKGRAPTEFYKAMGSEMAGFRCTASFLIAGREASAKGQRVAESIVERVNNLLAQQHQSSLEVNIEILGSEATYGQNATAQTREVVVKIAAAHAEKSALELFAREIAPAATSMAPGMTGLVGGRPKVSPRVRLHSCLLEKTKLPGKVWIDGSEHELILPSLPVNKSSAKSAPVQSALEEVGALYQVPLYRLAYARSGDKGDSVNIGVIARAPEYLPWIRHTLSAANVKLFMQHLGDDLAVERFEIPGIHALNFVLRNALGGGGLYSLRIDPQGKALAQQLLEMVVGVPAEFLSEDGCGDINGGN